MLNISCHNKQNNKAFKQKAHRMNCSFYALFLNKKTKQNSNIKLRIEVILQ